MLLSLVILHFLVLEGVAQKDEWDSEETVRRKSGYQVSFKCRNPTLNAGDSISWYRIKGNLASQLKTNRTSIDLNGTLHFAFVDANDTGMYKCGVNSATLDSISLGSGVNLIVDTEGPIASERKPELMYKSPDTKVDTGRNIELACAFAGKPVPTISWRHNGDLMTSNERIKLDGGKLSIDGVTPDDTGDYTCVGNNVAGSSNETIRLQLNGTAKPTTTTKAANDESTTGGSNEHVNNKEQVDKSGDNPSSASSTNMVIIVVVIVVVILIVCAVVGSIVWRKKKKERRLSRITKEQKKDLVVESEKRHTPM